MEAIDLREEWGGFGLLRLEYWRGARLGRWRSVNTVVPAPSDAWVRDAIQHEPSLYAPSVIFRSLFHRTLRAIRSESDRNCLDSYASIDDQHFFNRPI